MLSSVHMFVRHCGDVRCSSSNAFGNCQRTNSVCWLPT